MRGEDWVKVMKIGFLAFYGLLTTQAVVQNNLSVYLKRHQEHKTENTISYASNLDRVLCLPPNRVIKCIQCLHGAPSS